MERTGLVPVESKQELWVSNDGSWSFCRAGKVYQGSTLQQTNSLVYNPTTGTIQSKSDLDNYAMNYGEKGYPPHVLTSISGVPSIISNTAQTITYTDFKKVKQITEGSNVLDISYGTDEQRIKTTLSQPSGTLTRYYLGDYEEEVRNGNTRKIHYISGGNGLAAIYVQNNGNDTLYYAHTDYQGSLTAISLPNGTVKERYAYDPWGNRRNPTNWTQRDTRTAFIFNRGYTMHEHLPEFSLINMNGRVYDPLTSMFLSTDPYLQSPEDWLNFNRYTYALNNPFKYTDPSGNIFLLDDLIIGMVVGAMINTAIQGFSGHLGGQGSYWESMGIGALSGAAGAGAGSLVSGALGTATTLGGSILNGSAVGAAGGFAGGFIDGAGNAWGFQGASFGNGLKSGLISGGWGTLGGAVIGGITGSLNYHKQMGVFRKGNEILGTKPGDAVPATDSFLDDAQKAWYPDAPMENINKFTTENVPDWVFNNNDELGLTSPLIEKNLDTGEQFLTGKSNVYFSSRAFSSAKQLFFTMGHEFIHVSQYAIFAGTAWSEVNTQTFRDIMEFYAYNYQGTLMADGVKGANIQIFTHAYIQELSNSQYFTKLGGPFSWTYNVLFRYPF